MMVESIEEVLINRDGMSRSQARKAIQCAKEELQELIQIGDVISAEDICYEYFGLEPDYLIELM